MIGSNRIFAIAGGAAVVAVLAGGWLLGVQPALAAADTADQGNAAAAAQNQTTRIRLVQLSKAAAKTDAMKVEDATLQKAAPTILKPNRFIRRINELSALDGVEFVSMTPSDAVAYTAPNTAGGGGLALAKTDPLIKAANFTAVPVSVVVKGSDSEVRSFAKDLQGDERMFAIDSYQSSLGDDGVVTATIAGYIYTLKR